MEGMGMKVFVTGHKGYIGVHLVKLLKKEGHPVVGCDIDLFNECDWEPFTKPDIEIIKDIRDLSANDLKGCDCVMHLAAISNDPMGELNPEITYSVNKDGSIHLAHIAKKAGVKQFLFSLHNYPCKTINNSKAGNSINDRLQPPLPDYLPSYNLSAWKSSSSVCALIFFAVVS